MDGFTPARITEHILQNGYITEKEAAQLHGLGVTHVLNLDLPYDATRVSLAGLGLKVVEILLHDMAPMSQDEARRVVAAIQRAVDLDRGTVYVHCNAGVSRSPTAVWLYLVAMGRAEEEARQTIAVAARHLDAPDPILVANLDVAELRAWARAPRWELWRRGERTHDTIAGVFPTRRQAEDEVARIEARLREHARRRPPRFAVIHTIREAWTVAAGGDNPDRI